MLPTKISAGSVHDPIKKKLLLENSQIRYNTCTRAHTPCKSSDCQLTAGIS